METNVTLQNLLLPIKLDNKPRRIKKFLELLKTRDIKMINDYLKYLRLLNSNNKYKNKRYATDEEHRNKIRTKRMEIYYKEKEDKRKSIMV